MSNLDRDLVDHWHSGRTVVEIAELVGMKVWAVQDAWAKLRDRGELPRQPRPVGGFLNASETSRVDASDQIHCDGRPRIHEDHDPLLERLRRVHGFHGRPDLAAELRGAQS